MFDDTFNTPELQASYDALMALVADTLETETMVAVEYRDQDGWWQMCGKTTECVLGWFRANAENFMSPPEILGTWQGSNVPSQFASVYADYLERVRR